MEQLNKSIFYICSFQQAPLLGLIQDGGTTWIYPPSILEDLATEIGYGFRGGLFTGASCFGY